MKQQLPLVVLLVAAVVSQIAIGRAQQRGDLAKVARATPLPPATPSRVYTNKNLVPDPRDPAPRGAPAPAPVTTTPTPPAVATVVPVAAHPTQTEAYWKDRMRALALELEATAARVAGANDTLAGLQASAWRPGLLGAVVADNIFETRAALNQHLAAFQGVRTAIAALEEEARRAGVPPGWLRLP